MRPAYSMMWVKSVYEIYRLRGLRLGTESSLAAPEGINTTPSENCIQEESFNQNILQDQPKDGNKKEAPALLSCFHFYFPIHAGLATDTENPHKCGLSASMEKCL